MAGDEAAEKVHYSGVAQDLHVRLTRVRLQRRAFESGHGDGIVTRATVAETLHLAVLV